MASNLDFFQNVRVVSQFRDRLYHWHNYSLIFSTIECVGNVAVRHSLGIEKFSKKYDCSDREGSF